VGAFKLKYMNKTAMAEMIEWLQAYEYEIPLELQVKAKELLEKEKEQIQKAFLEGKVNHSKDWSIEYYNQTYNQNK
jgi:hypothetical protein